MTSSIFELPRLTEARTAWPTRSLRSMLQARAERGRPDLPLLSKLLVSVESSSEPLKTTTTTSSLRI